jgi:hypothetical protein
MPTGAATDARPVRLISCGQDLSELSPKSEHKQYSCQQNSDGYEEEHDYQVSWISGDARAIAIDYYCERVEKTPPDFLSKGIK